MTGTVPISDIKYIMEQMGPLGYQLNEYEQAKFWILLKNDLEYVTSMQSKDGDLPTVEIVEYINGNRHVNLVKDKEIDYAGNSYILGSLLYNSLLNQAYTFLYYVVG